MKSKIIYYALVIVFAIVNFLPAQNKIDITIMVETPDLPDSCVVFIAGNILDFGSWQPNKIALEKKEYQSWMKVFSLPAGQDLEFKFTLGDWSQEALSDSGQIPDNHRLKAFSDTLVRFEVCRWKNAGSQKNIGQVTGKLKYHSNFRSVNVHPRDIVVWLPPDYEESANHYPVLYMQDGQNIFDPLTSAFGIDWQVDETADSLIKGRDINPILVVGIYNSPLRTSEYTPNDTGYSYMRFVVDELKPFIDKNYRTLKDRHNTAVAGASAGGLISFMLAWEYPEIFSKAACLSSSFKIAGINFVDGVKNYKGEKKPLQFYFDNGGVGLEERLQPGIDDMLSALEERGYKKDEDIIWKKFSDDEHNEAAWAKRFYLPLKLFFSKD